MTKSRAVLELSLAGAIWGFGFVAVVWAMEAVGPLWLTALRFALAFAISLPLVLWRRPNLQQYILDARISFVPAILLTLTLILQTWGLKYTTATKAGFITALYIVIVPFVEMFRTGVKPHQIHLLAVAIGLAGMSAMTGVGLEPWNLGDLLTLGCAFTAALHIVIISHLSPKIHSTFRFNTMQSLWSAAIAIVCALLFESWGDPTWSTKAVGGLISLSVGSTAFAFFLQIRAQKVLSASAATMLYLLEAPFASLFGLWVLGESVTQSQAVGGVLIMLAAVLAAYAEGAGAPGEARS